MATAKPKTKKPASKKAATAKRRPRSGGATKSTPSVDSKKSRRQFTQVKQWLHGSRPHRPVSLVWQDDANLDQYEGRDGDDIRVVLTPHVDVLPLPKKLARKAQAEWDKERKKNPDLGLRRAVPLFVEKPSKKSGLTIFDARIHGFPYLANGGAVMYQIVAKDVAEAKDQITEVVIKLRLQASDVLLHHLSLQLGRPPEAVLHTALMSLYKANNTRGYVDDQQTPGLKQFRIRGQDLPRLSR